MRLKSMMISEGVWLMRARLLYNGSKSSGISIGGKPEPDSGFPVSSHHSLEGNIFRRCLLHIFFSTCPTAAFAFGG